MLAAVIVTDSATSTVLRQTANPGGFRVYENLVVDVFTRDRQVRERVGARALRNVMNGIDVDKEAVGNTYELPLSREICGSRAVIRCILL